MAIYAVVPVKKLADSKRRLSTVFTPQERQMLTLAMLKDVLGTLKTSKVNKVVVVGEDFQVRQTAEGFGALYISANGSSLNPAIEEAMLWCKSEGALSVLVLPADIPLLTAKDVNRVLELGNGGQSAVVLSPSGNWGTNALYQKPAKIISSCFGPKSFLNHLREAYKKRISVRVHFSVGLATDIDDVQDLKKVFETENDSECKQALKQITVGNVIARDFLLPKKEK